jgi:hypothetical protein
MAATVYSLGTWFVSGICVYIPCIKETMMMMMMIIMCHLLFKDVKQIYLCEKEYKLEVLGNKFFRKILKLEQNKTRNQIFITRNLVLVALQAT